MTTTGTEPPTGRRASLDRRALLCTGAAVALVSAGWARAADLGAAGLETLRVLADRLIPATETPGAVAAGCPAYVAGCIARAAEADRRRLVESLAPIAAALQEVGPDAPWPALVAKVRASSAEAGRSLRELRGLIIAGYYTSEPGASQELRYDAIPGRFDPSVPVTPITRAFSSDWNGVTMGGPIG